MKNGGTNYVEPFLGLLTAMDQAGILVQLPPDCAMKKDFLNYIKGINPSTHPNWLQSSVEDLSKVRESNPVRVARLIDNVKYAVTQRDIMGYHYLMKHGLEYLQQFSDDKIPETSPLSPGEETRIFHEFLEQPDREEEEHPFNKRPMR